MCHHFSALRYPRVEMKLDVTDELFQHCHEPEYRTSFCATFRNPGLLLAHHKYRRNYESLLVSEPT